MMGEIIQIKRMPTLLVVRRALNVMQSTLPSHPTFLNSYTSMYNWDRELMSASRVAAKI